MQNYSNITLNRFQIAAANADAERRLVELDHFADRTPFLAPRKLLGSIRRTEWLAMTVDARRAHLAEVLREQAHTAARIRVAHALTRKREQPPASRSGVKATPALAAHPSPLKAPGALTRRTEKAPAPTAPAPADTAASSACATVAPARSGARGPVVAYVACAGGCGRLLPSASTYKPSVKYCGGPRSGRRVPRCLIEEIAE